MKRATLMLAALALLMGGVQQARASPIVVNPSFEDVQIGSPFVSHNLADIPGWTHTGSLGDGPLWHIGYADGGGAVVVAGQGTQFVTMGGGVGPFGTSSFDQVVNGFTPGQSYTLTFDMATEGNFSAPQQITVDFPTGSSTGSQVFTAATPLVNYWTQWETKTMNFVATASSVDIRFTASTVFDVGLDDVRVSQPFTVTPEPASLTLLGGIGAACSLVYGWRRRRQLAFTERC